MKLAKRTWVPLDYLDETPWQTILEKFQFWKDSSHYLSDGSIHNSLAYFVMYAYGQYAWPENLKPSEHPFDQVAMPREVLESEELQSLLRQWMGVHEAVYGPGYPTKCGFYCVAPGGSCGYHVDGSVFDVGQRIDLSNPAEWDSIINAQTAHRTVLPLRMNKHDEFMIAGMQVRMTPGLWFEFSNTLPHAFFNNGDDYTVLLVTTWAAQSEMIQHTLINLR